MLRQQRLRQQLELQRTRHEAGPHPDENNLNYGALDNPAIAGFVLVVILLLVKYGKGFIANIAVLLGIVAGCVLATGMGKMTLCG